MIGVNIIGDPEHYQGESVQHLSEFSPDGELVAVVVRHGDVATNSVISSILVYRTRDLLRGAAPQTVATFAARSNRAPISHVRWLADGRTLVFLGTDGDRPSQVYRADVRSGERTQISYSARDISAFAITPSGARLVFTSEAEDRLKRANDSAFVVEGTSLVDVMLGTNQLDYRRQATHLFVQDIGRSVAERLPDPVSSEHGIGRCEDTFGIHVSPEGQFVLRFCYIVAAPVHWRAYTADERVRTGLAERSSLYITQYALIDLTQKRTTLLLDAPLPISARQLAPVWAPSRGSVIVGNAFMSLAPTGDTAERTRRTSTLHAIVEVNLRSRAASAVAYELPLTRYLRWDERSRTLLLSAPGARADEEDAGLIGYRAAGLRWQLASRMRERAPRADSNGRVALRLEQSLNDPPVLIAYEPHGKGRRMVLDPNPQLRAFALGRVEPIAWKSRSGIAWQGGLYYPPGHAPGRKYPVVIQTHGFDADTFSLYGAFTTAFAAQPLAARGILVLQMEDPPGPDNRDEARKAQEGFESGIEELDARGLIDRSRVGLIGFSRTSWYVKYFLTHSKYPIAAAAVSDGIDAGYFQYIAYGGPVQSLFDMVNGGAPTGLGLKNWLLEAPGFNLDKVSSPLRIEAIGMDSVAQEWEVYAGLWRLGRPVELLVIPGGIHELVRPHDRLASQGGNLDWFAFWLLGEEDSDPDKASQYARWNAMRKTAEGQVTR